jgi:hypothetical protein
MLRYAHEIVVPPIHVPMPLHTDPVMHMLPLVQEVPSGFPAQSVVCASAFNTIRATDNMTISRVCIWDKRGADKK